MQFREAAELYFAVKEGLMKPASFANLKRLYRDHIKQHLDNQELDEFTNRELQKFYNSLVKKKCANNTNKTLSKSAAKDIVGLVKTICYFAMDEGEMQEKRFKLKTPVGFREADNGQSEILPEEDYKKLLLICTDMESDMFRQAKVFSIIALTTGMRIGEVCGLLWEDIDFERGSIKVKRTVQRIINGDGSSYIHIGDPKTLTSKRDCILLDITKKVLMQYREKCIETAQNHYVLTNKSKPTEPRTVRQGYSRLLKANGITYIHPHALRHSFCTYSISNGGDVKTTSRLLGHANTGITLDTYTHITQKQIEKTVSTLNEVFQTF